MLSQTKGLLRSNRGLTLVELMITIVILSFIFLIISTMLSGAFSLMPNERAFTHLRKNERALTTYLVRDIKQAQLLTVPNELSVSITKTDNTTVVYDIRTESYTNVVGATVSGDFLYRDDVKITEIKRVGATQYFTYASGVLSTTFALRDRKGTSLDFSLKLVPFTDSMTL